MARIEVVAYRSPGCWSAKCRLLDTMFNDGGTVFDWHLHTPPYETTEETTPREAKSIILNCLRQEGFTVMFYNSAPVPSIAPDGCRVEDL